MVGVNKYEIMKDSSLMFIYDPGKVKYHYLANTLKSNNKITMINKT